MELRHKDLLRDINTIRKYYKTVENNGKKKLSKLEHVCKVKKECLGNDVLYLFTDSNESNLTVHFNTNIFNLKLLNKLLNMVQIQSFIDANEILEITHDKHQPKYPTILESDVLCKILNLEINNIIMFKNGTMRQVVSVQPKE
uniref:Uncharacterized protein n=1 Tax=Dikerogammarus haemobaphes virus 1 TaxID=2704946 RepID=A0A6G9HDG0_9VIRU|nr:hypothetical protein [Dikerogammarus haemobaphes virus 1]